MENYEQFETDFNECFDLLSKLTTASFELMDKQPQVKDEIVNMWKDKITNFISYTFKVGEKYDNKDVFKVITKSLIFGK